MPDQSSAAREHAILQEITAPLETLPDDPVAAVHADFPVGLRGYDRMAVDAYVRQTSQLVAELQATRSPEAAVRKALERVGEQISGILQRAHDTAEDITTQSRLEAEERLEHARIEAAEIIAAAHQRVVDLDADTDRIWIERHRIVDDARELAQQLVSLADAAVERFPAAAPEEAPGPQATNGGEPEVMGAEPEPELETKALDEDIEATTRFEALDTEQQPLDTEQQPLDAPTNRRGDD
jgi:cell division septum initiation protein DivIVA